MQWKIHCGAKRKLTAHRQTRQSRLLLVWNKVSAFKLSHFVRISNNKIHFVALYCVATDRCSTSVQAAFERIMTSSLLVIAQNKHERTSEAILFWTMERHQYTLFFKLKSTKVNLLSSLVCVPEKMADSVLWLVRSPFKQMPSEGLMWFKSGLGSESGIEYPNSGSLWEVQEVISLNSSEMLILM